MHRSEEALQTFEPFFAFDYKQVILADVLRASCQRPATRAALAVKSSCRTKPKTCFFDKPLIHSKRRE